MDTVTERAAPPNATLWSRRGFVGQSAVTLQPGYAPDYISVQGAHAPRRVTMADLEPADMTDPEQLPMPVLTSSAGVAIGLSRRRAPMPFVFRNVEADELHFVQSGAIRFETDFGVIDAGQDDFVLIPRSVAYRTAPLSDDLMEIILESPDPLEFDMPAPFGMINPGIDLRYAAFASPGAPGSPPHVAPPAGAQYRLTLKSHDGLTHFVKPADPLTTIAQVAGQTPVWALNLKSVQPLSYGGQGGPPAHFLAAARKFVLVFTLAARPRAMRAPVHHNADYDEIIIYARGPGAWGAVDRPGTLTIVPKGVTHHGPPEDVPEGYLAWLIETGATLRFTPEALAAAKLMETGLYGVHASAAGDGP